MTGGRLSISKANTTQPLFQEPASRRFQELHQSENPVFVDVGHCSTAP